MFLAGVFVTYHFEQAGNPILTNMGIQSAATSGQTSTVGEPSVATQNSDIFLTGNWYASRSSDNGANWLFVDPFSVLPPVDDGF